MNTQTTHRGRDRGGSGSASTLRVAVVGPGGWGRQHTRVFAARADTDLVAVVGRHPDRTAKAAATLGARAYTDIDRMIEAERPDLVSVSLPNEEHFEPTMRLLEHGIPLLVEKPLVFDLHQADTLLAAAAEQDTFFAIDFNHRYAEPVRRTRRAIENGSIGDPVFATWRFGGEANPGDSPHKNIIETQCHAFDMLEHLLGPITSVAAQMTNKTYSAWSTVALALEFDNGAVGTVLGTYDSSYAYRDTHLLEVNGTTGRAVIHDTVRSLELARVGDETASVWQPGYFDDEARSFHATFDRYVDDMLAAFRAGSPPPVPASAGRRALLIAQRAIESHETGARTAVEPDAPVTSPTEQEPA
ncbi:gfo/Idh/MocA family oxidoreductase [Curtobacterium sp. MCBD17_013]|uniref:Gfo/Idh/MocA family protein n=1 Tax=Curtobacterium sp. MCBD17_013 TaxID=2175668 RepID=UPI000DAA0FB5|nr:Gfo/Idh/MocA family oxidoreductase [Curtobacterium sp. MCBD17_013]PZF65149.1 gfo/Idh/MocA family oxidoreductase [Curtobacterium sp. MCBD17_013]